MLNVRKNLFLYNIKYFAPVTVRRLFGSMDDFDKAKDNLNKLKKDPGSEKKLQLYALFKQVTEGKCTKPKPGITNFVDRAKWEAWTSLGDMEKEKAVDSYVAIIEELLKEQKVDTEKSCNDNSVKSEVEGIDLTKRNGVLTIRLNRINKKNALTWEMYNYWSKLLKEADNDSSVGVVVVTGSGDYFCSGNDLSNFTKVDAGVSREQMAAKGKEVLRNFVGSFIDFSKPLIALVNGPAIGISVTTLGLYDVILASDNATFSTPFSNLGQTPEGCSTYTFPKIFGPIKANDIIIFNKTLSANEALGLVTRVFPDKVFQEEAWKIVNEIASLPPQTVKFAKELIRGPIKKELHEVNKNECDRLMERWLSDECIEAITKFFSRKSPKL